MRVLFVEKQIDYEPQGIMQLSACLKGAGHDVELAIASHEDPVQFAVEYGPDLVGYSVMTGSQQYYLELNRQIRQALGERMPFSVFGGPHPTFFPDMIHEPGVDGICIGEGEGAIVDLANSLDGNGHRRLRRADIPNWWFKLGGEVVRNPVRPLIDDLGSLPRPDRPLIYDRHPASQRTPIKHFLASRGCPYACTYCFNHAYYQIYKKEKRGHQRPVDTIIDEVNWVRENWPLQYVVFVDDLFILYDDWLEELAEKWPQQVGLPFFCNIRANLIVRGPQKVDLLKKAGCATVSMGIEAANDRIRYELLKRRMSREDIVQAGRMIRDAGLQVTATNILALPTSRLEDDLETMRLNAAARITYAYAFLFQPYPGTELGQFTQEGGYMAGSFDDIGEIAWERSILTFESEDEKRQIEHLQRLFALGAQMPWLEPLIRRLIKLPHNRLVDTLFWWVHKLHKGLVINRRVHPAPMSLRDLWAAARLFFGIRS